VIRETGAANPDPLSSAPDSSFRPASCIPVIRITADRAPDLSARTNRTPPQNTDGSVLTRRQSSPANLSVPDGSSPGK
jgi:hypothetical protein